MGSARFVKNLFSVQEIFSYCFSYCSISFPYYFVCISLEKFEKVFERILLNVSLDFLSSFLLLSFLFHRICLHKHSPLVWTFMPAGESSLRSFWAAATFLLLSKSASVCIQQEILPASPVSPSQSFHSLWHFEF